MHAPAGSTVATDRTHHRITLDDAYGDGDGRALLSGIQALVRLVLEQRRLDRRRGLDTAAFVSGYEGSPLGGLDLELGRAAAHLAEAGVVFTPGLNEESAATAVGGTQLLHRVPGHAHDGVVGLWYGKNPGLDRAADAIRHATWAGTSPLGGAVAVIGDDPGCKSSTLPSSCLPTARGLHLPVLTPGSVADVLHLGLHAVALSRYAGLWCGLQVAADVADACAVVDLGRAADGVPFPDTGRAADAPLLVGRRALGAETDLLTVRLPRVLEYARAVGLNARAVDPPRARIGVVAGGTAFAATVRALADLGLDDDACRAVGLRLIRIGLPWPLDASDLRRLTAGLTEVLVVEDKGPFLETLVKEALYDAPGRPLVTGATDPDGRPLLPTGGAVDADDVARALASRLPADRLPPAAVARLDALTPRHRLVVHDASAGSRTPTFCSGCPHNRSTRADDDQLVGLGIGCHIMAGFDDHGRGRALGLTQMGGEGTQWIGLAPFAGGRHFVQNLGDGTFFHSGSLAVRAAVASGTSLTFKLLYNDVVAMTGGQRAVGRMAVPELTRLLALEGVRRVVVATPDPRSYRRVRLDPIASVVHRDRTEAALDGLRRTGGVTVLLYDDGCAAEERRRRHRGQLPAPTSRVWINPRVCEGCGDCGERSSCLSVVPVDTEFGRKTAIHQGSCNDDRSCLDGDCPSFVLVRPGRRTTPASPFPAPPVALVDPAVRRTPADLLVRMPGIGGTGVVTVSRILQMAAHLDGRYAAGLDQTGLAQKGGPVVSDVRIASAPIAGSVRAGARSADLLLALDLVAAADRDVLDTADPDRTVAVVNTARVATAAMVHDASLPFPADADRIVRATRSADALHLDAQWIAERLFRDHLPANLVLLGAAFQHGCLPVSAAALEEAVRLHGVDVERNLAAVRWGRAAALDPDAVVRALAPAPAARPSVPPALAARVAGAPAALTDALTLRVADLAEYQDVAYAGRYLETVLEVARAEEAATGDPAFPVSAAVVDGLAHLLAVKDEYEVARLHLDPAVRTAVEDEFGPGTRTSVLLSPPTLRALGLRGKVRVGRAAGPMFRLLRAGRRLRGTALDPFGHTALRRTERALPDEYLALVRRGLAGLTPQTAPTVVAIAALAGEVRGYEDVRRRSIDRFRRRAAELEGRLAARGGAGPTTPAHHWPVAG